MESTFSLRSFVRHLMVYAMALLRKSVLDSAEGASLLVAKLVALLIILLIVPVKALFIDAANHCKSSNFEDELGKDWDELDPLEDSFDGDEEA